MEIGDLIFKMMGRPDPREALMQAVQGQGQPAPQQPGQPAPGATQQAMGTPGGTPAPAAPPQPEVYQSPPQLFELYTQLLDREEKNAAINRGIGLIGAGLAHEENRAGILQAFTGGSSSGGSNSGAMFEQLMKFQGAQTELAKKAAQRAAIPDIAKQYGLDTKTALYLYETGKLDAVIAEAEKPDKQIVTQEDGTSVIVDKTDGSISQPFGVPKKREIELVDDPITGGKVAVYKDTKERVGEGKLDLPGSGNTEQEQLYNAAVRDLPENQRPTLQKWLDDRAASTRMQVNVGPQGIDYGPPPKDMAWKRDAAGKVMQDANGAPIAVRIGSTESALEIEAGKTKDAEREGQAQQAASIVTEDVDRAIKLIEDNKDTMLPVTGIRGKALSALASTDAYNLEALLTTVRSNLGFDALSAMRAASPTGAALGPVSDFENKLLQSVTGNLDIGQDHDQLMANLKRIRRMKEGVINGEFVMEDGKTPNPMAVSKALQELEPEAAANETPIEDLIKKWNQ